MSLAQPRDHTQTNMKVVMRTLTKVFALLLWTAGALLADEQKHATTNAPPPAQTGDLALREVRYQGKLGDNEARFTVEIEVESASNRDTSTTLFDGEVAVLPAKLPSGLRIVREGRQYRLVASKPGKYKFKLELVAKITRAEPWNQISFAGPTASIASVTAAADGDGIELQLLSGTPLDNEAKNKSQVRGVLGADRNVVLRWQTKTADAARKALITCETIALAQITPTVIKFVTELRYDIVQGNLSKFSVVLPANHALTRVEGEQIRDWQASMDGDLQILTVELIKPVEKSYALKLLSEQTVESTPFTAQLNLPQPQGIERETGSLTVTAEDTLVETESTAGLRQINAPAGSLAAYRFYGRPLTLGVKLRRIEPVINVASRITTRLEEARLLVAHALTLKVQKAGIYSVELSPLGAFTVTDVRGEGIEDWKARDGKLVVSFSSRVLGERKLEVQLEQPQKTFPDQITVIPLQLISAVKQTAQIGAASAPGIRLKTSELIGLREIPVSGLANRADDLLAYVADQPDWLLKLSVEKLAPRIIADVFNLVTIGDGLLGGSATIRYVIINQGVQEFKVRLPSNWKNVEFTGPNIRRKEQAGDIWTVALQDKVWGGYTLVVTYDEQFDPHQATLQLGGVHALEVERETGSVAVTSAAGLELRETKATEPLRRIDESELAETDRALISRSVLLAYRYGTGDAYELAVDATRFKELPVLEAVADRTQLTTVVTEVGEMLTQATFMIKNNDKQFQSFTLPKGATFWSAYVNGQAVKAETTGDKLLIPLPRGANRDQAFAVEIVYAQNVGSLRTVRPREIALAAPKTDIQTTFAEWELYVPATHQLAKFGGNMTVARGTNYSLRDAWQEFTGVYRDLWRNTKGVLVGLLALAVVAALLIAAIRRGLHGAMTVVIAVAVIAVLGGMMLPALGTARAKAVRAAAVNNLKQIGLALRTRADENKGHLPASLDEVKDIVGTERVLIDPVSGQRFEYPGAGRDNVRPDGIVAYSPLDRDGRAVLLGDGSVVQMQGEQFGEALRQSQAALSGNTWALAGATPTQTPADGGGFGAAAVNGTTAATAAASTSVKAPMARGIRPIRIDIPRTGQKFTFTKVLNIRDEALAFEAWAVTTKVLNIMRSALQVTVFVAGLLLLWWQLRRAAPRRLAVTLALALILGSIGHLLITARLLGMAMIVTLPTLLVVLAILFARRLWRHRGGEATGTTVSTPTPPAANGATGMGPAVAAIALMFSIATTNARELSNPGQSPVGNQPSAVEFVSIQSATYTGAVHERVARIETVIQLSAARAGEIVPLFSDDVAVEEFSATPGSVKLLRQGNAVSVRLPKKGEALLKVKFLVKLGGDVTKRQLAFGIPPALSSKLALTVDEPEAAVEFPTAVSYHSVVAQQQTRVEAVIGAGERVEMHWTPRVKRATEIAATVFCQNATLVSFSNGVVTMRSLLDYQVTQGELRQARVRIPPGRRLLRVDGEAIRTWQVKEDGATQVLTVELLKGVSPKYRLAIETEKAVEKMPDTFALETPHALDVKRETGLVALNGNDELGLTVETAQGLQKMDAAEFANVMATTGSLAGAYQFLKPDFTLSVRVETLQPQIEAMVRNRVRIGVEQIYLDAKADYTIKRAGVFALRLALPTDYRIESVAGNEIAQWTEKTENNARVLEVTLKQRTLGNYSLQVRLVKTQKELAKTVEVAGVHPLDTAKLTGFIVVASETGVQAKTASFEGLTEVPVTTVPEGGTGLAYKFISSDPVPAQAPWKLAVATEAIESWVRAEVINWLTLSDTLVSGRALVRYEIQNAPVKEFRLKIPAAFKNIEITGANIRRRDQNGEEWRVELQNKVVGNYLLTVTWEQPWNVKEQAKESLFDADGVQALGVERETGALAVIARSQLQVTAKQASSELVRVDPQELPEWAGRADSSTVLAYRYLRPGYKLSLAAQRFAQAEVLQAIVDDARLTTVVADDGQMMTELALSIRNNGRQFLEVALPKGAQVWSAFVGGRAVKPGLRDGKLVLPLERTQDSAVAVELIYVSAEKFPRTKGPVDLASPALDVPAKNARWELYLPLDYDYGRFAGTMTRQTDALPVYRSFTLTEYSQIEAGSRREREIEASGSINEARSKLAGGKLKEAAMAYNQARFYNNNTEAEQAEVKKLEADLRKAQSSNLVNAQRALIDNNALFVQQAGERPAQEVQLNLQYDDKAAEKQWEKLQRAQEVTTVAAQPLRVNLPARGLRQSFSQILQTEVGKPMLIHFVAANAKAASWPMRIGLLAAGFVGLWALVNLMFGQRKMVATTA
jgi:type II secretory pathway pseudopilin PulG